MSLNTKDNIVNRVSNMEEEDLSTLDLQVYLIQKATATTAMFISKKAALHSELRKWIKKSVRRELNELKKKGEDGNKSFHIEDYNHEIKKRDYIAKLDTKSDPVLSEKKNKLIQALSQRTLGINDPDDEVKFQVLKVRLNNEDAYFIYYRGVKKHSLKKKSVSRIPTIKHGEQLVIQDKEIIEFGGKIELIIVGDVFYIVNPRTLEHTFDYEDHISKKRDANLAAITNMDFFDEHSNVESFTQKSSQYILSRSLASISQETLNVLQENFIDRCDELKTIKEGIPKDSEERKKYMEKYESIWPLYDYLDLDSYKVRFKEEKSVTPLLHFFSDRIVESFLTKKFRNN